MSKIKEFCELIKSIRIYDSKTVFNDFVNIAAITIQNQYIFFNQNLEDEYMSIVKKYANDNTVFKEKFPKMFILLYEFFGCFTGQLNFIDFFQEVYNEFEFKNSNIGQIFSPKSLSNLISKIMVGENKVSNDDRIIKVSEPACGTGGMIISMCDELYSKEINYSNNYYFECVDIDYFAFNACYVQLSLLGVSARIFHGNTLTLKYNRSYITPAYLLTNMGYRLDRMENNENKEII